MIGCTASSDRTDDSAPASLPSTAGSPTTNPTAPACTEPCYAEPETTGRISADVVTSVSGMAASRRNPGAYYVVSDEEGTSTVTAIKEDGTVIATFSIDGMSARNAEALAVGSCGAVATTCLYIGDIGNHVGLEDLFVYKVDEPDLDDPPSTMAAEELRYSYPDKPTDAEALMVDSAGRPYVVSKASFNESTGETEPTVLYRGLADGGVLERLAEIELPEPKGPSFADLVGNVVTGASAANGKVLLRTYDLVVEYRSPGPAAEMADFPSWEARSVPAPDQLQSESITYRADGCGYLTTAEFNGEIGLVPCTTENGSAVRLGVSLTGSRPSPRYARSSCTCRMSSTTPPAW